jgi:hypothetical protein
MNESVSRIAQEAARACREEKRARHNTPEQGKPNPHHARVQHPAARFTFRLSLTISRESEVQERVKTRDRVVKEDGGGGGGGGGGGA